MPSSATAAGVIAADSGGGPARSTRTCSPWASTRVTEVRQTFRALPSGFPACKEIAWGRMTATTVPSISTLVINSPPASHAITPLRATPRTSVTPRTVARYSVRGSRATTAVGPLLSDAAAFEDDDAIREYECIDRVVGDDDGAILELLQEAA